MKWMAMLLALCAGTAVAQMPSPRVEASEIRPAPAGREYVASYKDLYCAGFLSHEHFDFGDRVIGGSHSPETTHFGLHETVFLAGSGYQVGEKYTILRDLHDENRGSLHPEMQKDINRLGHLYAELGQVRVTGLENGYALAKIEASCESIVPGDIVIPFREKTPLTVPPRSFEFPIFGVLVPPRHGRIVASKDFDNIFGTHKPVYINLGSNEGLRPGDYLRISRSYDPAAMPAVDKLLLQAPRYDDSQRDAKEVPPKTMKNWPVKGVGEMVVISVTPETATCLITLALEEIELGDIVAREERR